MKTVEVVLCALNCVLMILCITFSFGNGNIYAGIAYIVAILWYFVACIYHRRAENYKKCCEATERAADDLIESVRRCLEKHEHPEPPEMDGGNHGTAQT